MKTSAESMSWYKKVDETWKSVGVNPNVRKSTPADYKVACKTIKALWKKEMGTKFPYTFKEVSGNNSEYPHPASLLESLLVSKGAPKQKSLSRSG